MKLISLIAKCLITTIYFIVFGILSYYVYKLNIIPNKYLIVIYSLVGLSTILLIINLFKSKRYIKIYQELY